MGTIVLRDGVIFDGHSPELLDGADVLIEDGEIKEVSAIRSRPPAPRKSAWMGGFSCPV